MPHVIVNYSANLSALDQPQLLQQVNKSLVATDLFVAHDIKARIFKDDVFLIGLNEIEESYIHLKLYLLSGRTDEQKQAAGEVLLKTLEQKTYLKSEAKYPIQICVEVIDMPRENYFKATV